MCIHPRFIFRKKVQSCKERGCQVMYWKRGGLGGKKVCWLNLKYWAFWLVSFESRDSKNWSAWTAGSLVQYYGVRPKVENCAVTIQKGNFSVFLYCPTAVNMWWEYFSFNFWTVFHPSELKLSDLEKNWAKTVHFPFNTLKACIILWYLLYFLFFVIRQLYNCTFFFL